MPDYTQFVFDFIEPPDPRRPRYPERVFTCTGAGDAGPAVAACRERILRENAIFEEGIAPARFHVSLCGLGDYVRIPSRVPFIAARAAGRVAMPPFEVVLHRAVTLAGFPRRRATVLLAESEGLRELGAILFGTLRQVGLKAGKPTMPHMTLFYSERAIRPVDIEPIRFRVDCFYLVHSERGLTRYTVLGCWPLGDPPPGAPASQPLAFGSMAA